MKREFRFRLSDVDNVLHEFENRGEAFFDETMRLARFLDLLNKSKMKADFEQKVVGDAPQLIERRVSEVIDWMVAADLRQWQAVMDHLQKRRHEHADRIVGQVGRSFDYSRTRLLDSAGREAQKSVASYDKEAEANRLAESVQVAVAGTALVEVGAIGLGAVLTHIAVTAAADVTGILAAGTIAVLGFFIIPNRRHDAKKELRQKIETLARAAHDRSDQPVRPRDREQPAADRRGDRPLYPLRPRRARQAERCPQRAPTGPRGTRPAAGARGGAVMGMHGRSH